MPASNLALIFQPGLLRHRSAIAQAGSGATSPDAPPGAAKAQIEVDAAEHKRSQEVLVFLIEHQTAFELKLPPHVRPNAPNRAISGASSNATGTSIIPTVDTPTASTPPAVTPETSPSSAAAAGSFVPGSTAPVELLGRKLSDRRRLRRKSADARLTSPAAGVQRSQTVDGADGGGLTGRAAGDASRT